MSNSIISFACAACGAKLESVNVKRGTVVDCPTCQASITVPLLAAEYAQAGGKAARLLTVDEQVEIRLKDLLSCLTAVHETAAACASDVKRAGDAVKEIRDLIAALLVIVGIVIVAAAVFTLWTAYST